MEHDLGSEFTTMKERAMDQIIQDMGISDVNNNDSMLLRIDTFEGAISPNDRNIAIMSSRQFENNQDDS